MDLFGSAFKAFYTNGKASSIKVWLDDELQPPLEPQYFFRSFQEMPELEQKALQMATGLVLDIGAASGCHSIWLQSQDKNVTSLEISPGACEVMRIRGLEQVINVNLFDFETEQRFDTILLLMNGLGMGKSLSGTKELFSKLKTLMKPGGRVIGDTSDIEYFRDEEVLKGKKALQSQGPYYGEVRFSLEWEGMKDNFSWIYPDQEVLSLIALQEGFEMEVVSNGPHYDYLLCFTLLDGSQ